MGEHLRVLCRRIHLRLLLLVPQNLKAQLTLLLDALVLQELVEAAAAKLLPIFKEPKGAEVPRLPRVDRASLHVPLAVAQGRPALHPLPGKMIKSSCCMLNDVNGSDEKVLHEESALQHLLSFCQPARCHLFLTSHRPTLTKPLTVFEHSFFTRCEMHTQLWCFRGVNVLTWHNSLVCIEFQRKFLGLLCIPLVEGKFC